VNAYWNLAWTAHTQKRPADALPLIERTASAAETDAKAILPEVLYDLAVIRLAAGKRAEAVDALSKAIALNRGLATQARSDGDLAGLAGDPAFQRLIR
jgi:tetratricopeptide (TPR) repeat protein